MLNKFRNYAVAILFATLLIASQSFAALTGVTVSATLTDPASNTWSNAVVTFVFQAGPGGVTPGTNQSTATQVVTTNSSGAFSGVLLGDTSILGGGSRWQFSVVGANGQTFGGLINVTASTTSLSDFDVCVFTVDCWNWQACRYSGRSDVFADDCSVGVGHPVWCSDGVGHYAPSSGAWRELHVCRYRVEHVCLQ